MDFILLYDAVMHINLKITLYFQSDIKAMGPAKPMFGMFGIYQPNTNSTINQLINLQFKFILFYLNFG